MPHVIYLERLAGRLYWQVPPCGVGRWSNDFEKAKKYSTERAAHIAWTAVSKRYPSIRCLPLVNVNLKPDEND